MMDGRNSSGRKVSLLNDSDVAAAPTRPKLPSLSAHYSHSHSRASSSTASSPGLTPLTPQLVRSSSSDSRTFASPSPLTPSLNAFEQLSHSSFRTQAQPAHQQHYYIHNPSYAKMDDPNASLYPPLPDATGVMPTAYPMPQMPIPMPTQPNQHMYRSSTSPASEPSHVSAVSAASNQKGQPKPKNHYPCPMAKQYGCSDFFTTSGHAARHAKKHTGKKDAFCPECNKAFTRKDNMEQHRRTHQNGRGGSRATNSDDSKVKKPTKASSKKNVIKAEPQQLEAAVQQELAELQPQPVQAPPLPVDVVQAVQAQAMQQAAVEQALMLPATTPYFVPTLDTGPIPALPNAMPDLMMRPPLQRSNFATSLEYIPSMMATMPTDPDALHYSYPSPGLSNGLNSLALAASEHRRLSEEKLQSQSPQESPSNETPTEQTP